MDSTDVKLLMEAYSAVYDEDLRDELESIDELDEDLAFIDDLSDEELDLVMEEILLDGGFTLDECINISEYAILTEESEMQRMNRLMNKRTRAAKSEKATAIRMKAAERERVGRKQAIKRIQVSAGRAAQKIGRGAKKLKTYAGGASSAVQGGARDLGAKLKGAKERITGFLGRVGRAAKAGYKAGKAEFSGQAAREAEARTQQRQVARTQRRAERRGASRDTSEFERRKPTGPKPGLPPRMRSASIVPVSRGERIASRQSAKSQAGPRTVRTGYPSGGIIPVSIKVEPQPAISGTKAAPALPAGKETTSSRRQAALQKMQKARTGSSARGVRFAGPSGEVAPKRAHTGIRDAASRFAKKAGLTQEEIQLLLPYILEDIIAEGYAKSYDEAYEILESLSDYDFDELVESYIEENVESYDFYDVVLEHLLDEGYADTEEDAEVIMANMSEEWVDDILEGVGFRSPYEGKPSYKDPWGKSPATKAAEKRQELERTQPGTKRQKLQSRRSEHLDRMFGAARRA